MTKIDDRAADLIIYTEYVPGLRGWVAYEDNYDGAPDSTQNELGMGATEAEAIADLKEQLTAKAEIIAFKAAHRETLQ